MSEIKLCADCKHVRDRTKDQTWWTCGFAATPRLTDGNLRYEHCGVVRVSPSLCGLEAKWFEPREPQPPAGEEPPDQYNRKLDDQHLGDEEPFKPKCDPDQVADDPRRGQAAEINKLR